MKHLAIIADDLTGAADAGVQFSRKGLNTIVTFDRVHFSEVSADADVFIVDTDSRARSAGEAYERVKTAALQLKNAGFERVYKKMDSTLRGNPGAEIDGIMDAWGYDLAVIAPAFPRIGRTTSGGIHRLNGVQLEQTEFSRDLKCPVRESNVVKLLATQSRRTAGLVNKQLWSMGSEAVQAKVDRLVNSGTRLIVFDAETEDDLKNIVYVMAKSEYSVLWAGSAGLGEYLPEALSLPVTAKAPLDISQSDHPVMLVAGSISGVTGEQISYLKLEPNVMSVELNPVLAAGEKDDAKGEIERCCMEINGAIEQGRDISFYVGSSPALHAAAEQPGAAQGIDVLERAARIATALGSVSSRIVRENRLAGLILTGGDTAKAVCKELSVTGLQLVDELEPGVPLNKLVGCNDLLAVTKAGGFGTKETLVRALYVLKGKIKK